MYRLDGYRYYAHAHKVSFFSLELNPRFREPFVSLPIESIHTSKRSHSLRSLAMA
jgi:hypothetical protein